MRTFDLPPRAWRHGGTLVSGYGYRVLFLFRVHTKRYKGHNNYSASVTSLILTCMCARARSRMIWELCSCYKAGLQACSHRPDFKKMPGYNIVLSSGTKVRLLCPECKLLLREPVQTTEGIRLCKTCYDAIARWGNRPNFAPQLCSIFF